MTTVYLDTETTGLDPFTDRLVAIGVAIDDKPPRALLHPVHRELAQRVLELDATFIGHNLGFDWHFIEAAGYRLPDPERWLDTQLLAHVAGTDGERLAGNTSLDRLTGRLIDSGELPGAILEPEARIKRWLTAARRSARKDGRKPPEKGDAPAELLAPYLRADVEQTRAVARRYRDANGQDAVFELERRCLPAVYAAERRGVPVDVEAAHAVRAASVCKLQNLRERLFELAGQPFSLDSSQQLEPILTARGVDLSEAPRTPTGLLARSAQALELIDDELVRVLLEHRSERVFHGLLDGLIKRIRGGRLHGSFRQVGTETGRMSSGSPNLQNIPASDLRARYLVCAGAGKVLVGADLDNVELRVLACYAPGGALERAFRDGVDLHQQTADELGIERAEGKTINYAIQYGAGVPLIASRLGIDRDEAKAILDRWYRLYPEVSRLKAQLARKVTRRGYVESILGRRHHFDQSNHLLLNRLISGSCADLFKRSIVELHRAGAPMILFVHDEIVCEVDQDHAGDVVRLLETELARPAYRPGVRIDRLVVNATVAERWAWFKQPDYVPWEGQCPSPPTPSPRPSEPSAEALF